MKTKGDLAEFFARYGAVLEHAASYVHGRTKRGQRYTTTEEVARWIGHDLPTLYRQTFGRTPKELKTWRVASMLAHATYLGAMDALDVRCVRGRGFTPAKQRAKHLRRVA